MQLHEHFKRSEFQCKCGCGFDTVDAELLYVLIKLRAEFNAVVHIYSGSRCRIHNGNIDGSEKSLHLIGRAADVAVEGVHPDIIADYFEDHYPQMYGIGRYVGRTHIDTRKNQARWDYRVKQ
ncbi:MAG: serine/threonine protein kinase [Verrucomicrobia bacterium]|nr:MAG: serine/threonine protein kinase [Verrucomicrobiota bacterium]